MLINSFAAAAPGHASCLSKFSVLYTTFQPCCTPLWVYAYTTARLSSCLLPLVINKQGLLELLQEAGEGTAPVKHAHAPSQPGTCPTPPHDHHDHGE